MLLWCVSSNTLQFLYIYFFSTPIKNWFSVRCFNRSGVLNPISSYIKKHDLANNAIILLAVWIIFARFSVSEAYVDFVQYWNISLSCLFFSRNPILTVGIPIQSAVCVPFFVRGFRFYRRHVNGTNIFPSLWKMYTSTCRKL